MATKIVWSENALEDLEKLKLYLERNWPEKVPELCDGKISEQVEGAPNFSEHREGFVEVSKPPAHIAYQTQPDDLLR